MSGPDAYNVPVAPVRPPGSRLAILVILVLVGGLGAAVGLGLLSSRGGPVPTEPPVPARSHAPAASAPLAAVASPTPAPATPAPNPPSVLPFIAEGFDVVNLPPAFRANVSETPQRVVTFRVAEGSGSPAGGSIVVAAGTPAAGPAVGFSTHPLLLDSPTLPDLEVAYRTRFGPVQTSLNAVVDSQPARILVIQPLAGFEPPESGWHAVALVAVGLRTFVIDAYGFGDITDSRAPDDLAALHTFLAAVRFTGPGLFATRELGFQAELPAHQYPYGQVRSGPTGLATGLFVFGDGTTTGDGSWSNRIGVAVGTKSDPAQAFILPLLSDSAVNTRIWGSSLASLQKAYLAALGDQSAKVTEMTFKGQPAVQITAGSGPAIALLTVHGDRVYIISTSGYDTATVAPDYLQFLESFAFID